MRKSVPDVLEKARIHGRQGWYPGEFYGNFCLKIGTAWVFVIASRGEEGIWPFAGEPWDHVSVSVKPEPFPGEPCEPASIGQKPDRRCPTWEEMCRVKELFFDDDECVIQFHPPKADYVNCHPYTLHLWRPVSTPIPMPPKGAV